MPSIIPGFEYDIFISYRQKDNEYDGWVTEFVSKLKKELTATFKEEVSVYFDVNPLDGLHETYDVDDSLKKKLKCLIFIPIISHTYCDPKCFAWRNEFLVFKEFASSDALGLKIVLTNGNVTSRILPVRIHDLDPDDRQVFEKEAGTLRSIDFIFRSAGVNRPLKSHEDQPLDNLNKTFYRDQINKVSNAVKEIISSLKKSNGFRVDEKTAVNHHFDHRPLYKKKRTYVVATLLCIIFLLLGYETWKWLSSSQGGIEEGLDRSIAVLPFDNLSGDPDQEYFSDGMMDEIINQLAKIKDLQVTSRTSSMHFKNSRPSLKEIAGTLGVTKVLEGSVRSSGSRLRISVKLIDAMTDRNLWSETYEKTNNIDAILGIQTEIALNIARALNTILTSHEEKSLQQIPTQNLEAYQLFLKARQIAQDREEKNLQESIAMLQRALVIDPDFTQAKSELANTYFIYRDYHFAGSEGYYEKAEQLAREAIENDPNQPLAYLALAGVNERRGDFRKFRQYLDKVVALNSRDAEILHRAATLYAMLGDRQLSQTMADMALKTDPFSTIVNRNYMRVLFYNRDYAQAEKTFPAVMARIPDSLALKEEMLQEYRFEMGVCDSLPSAYNQTLCFVAKGEKSRASQNLKTLVFDDTEEGKMLADYFNALVNEDADLLFGTLRKMWTSGEWKNRLVYLKTDRVYDLYRSDPRYQKLIKEIGLED